MRKLAFFVLTLILLISNTYSQFSSNASIRFRSELGTVGSNNYDNVLVTDRKSDIRIRPSLFYKANENLMFGTTLEMGDTVFGDSSSGGAQGTDGKVVEVKHLYMKINPPKFNLFSNHQVTLGLQPYYDLNGLVFDDDIAGIYYKGNIKKINFEMGWFTPYDLGEASINSTTYSTGESLYLLGGGYEVYNNINAGLLGVLSIDDSYEEEDEDHVKQFTKTSFWIAPYVDAKYGDFEVKTEFAYYREALEEDYLIHKQKLNDHAEHGGVIYSLKADYQANEKFKMRLNLLVESGVSDSKNGGYHGHTPFYNTDLEIMNSDGAMSGIYSYNPLDLDGDYGLVLPAFTADYELIRNNKYINSLSLSGFTGLAIAYNGVPYNSKGDKSRFIGVEYGLRSNIKLFDDLNVIPYCSVFHTGEARTKRDDVDTRYKVGVCMNASL